MNNSNQFDWSQNAWDNPEFILATLSEYNYQDKGSTNPLIFIFDPILQSKDFLIQATNAQPHFIVLYFDFFKNDTRDSVYENMGFLLENMQTHNFIHFKKLWTNTLQYFYFFYKLPDSLYHFVSQCDGRENATLGHLTVPMDYDSFKIQQQKYQALAEPVERLFLPYKL